jgi:hypothetical protein
MSVARIYKVGSPYNGSELAEVDCEQSASTMYLAHLNHPPTKLVRADHTSWVFSTISFAPTLGAPGSISATATTPNTDTANSGAAYFPQVARYQVTAIDDDTGQESRPSATATATNSLNLVRNYNTITWGAVSGAERYRVYKSNVTGDFGYIGSTTSLTFTDDNIGPDLTDGPPSAQNPFPTSNDYPSTVTFYQQRLGWARTNNHPNAMYFSRSGEFENMDESRPLKASDALSFALLAGKVNAVNQLVPMNQLLALTSDSVFAVNGGPDGVLTPSTIVASRQTGRGSSRLNPLVIDNVAFYQTSIGFSIRTLGYEFSTDGYNSNDVTIFSPHLFEGFSITSWAYAGEPYSVVWAARDDGKLLAFTWQQEQQIWGWTLCDTDGFVESVTSISESGEDRVYLCVRRTISGVSRRFIERMASAFWTTEDDACFMDAAVTYSFTTATQQVSNLGHLEGKEVVAVADRVLVTGLTVEGGRVTLPDPALRVTVGLPYVSTVETLPLAIQTSKGWSLAQPQQVSKVALRVIESRGVYSGPTDDKLSEAKPRTNEPFGVAPSLRTGMLEAILQPHIRSGASGDPGVTIVVQSPHPLPFTLTSVFYDPSVS